MGGTCNFLAEALHFGDHFFTHVAVRTCSKDVEQRQEEMHSCEIIFLICWEITYPLERRNCTDYEHSKTHETLLGAQGMVPGRGMVVCAPCQINTIVCDSPAMEVPDDLGRLVAFPNQKAVPVPRGVQLGRQRYQSRVLRVRLQR